MRGVYHSRGGGYHCAHIIMATLVLVRHGQASFGKTNYDQLSPLGEEQSRRLGAHWAKSNARFDAVYTGPRERQIHTARLSVEAMRHAGLAIPDPVVVPELDEVAAEDVIQEHLPRLIAEHAELRNLMAKMASGETRSNAFNELLMSVAGMWLRGEIDVPGLESWEGFCERVARGLDSIRSGEGKGRRIVAFTSGGTIGASLHRVLGLDAKTALNLAQVVRNTSVTEVLSSGERLTLATFNAVPHLEDPALVTYR